MKFRTERSCSSAEAWLIALTLFCLPLFEAPKNVFSILFLIVWIVQAVRTRSLGLSCRFDWCIWGLAAVLWIAPGFSSYGDTINALNSAPRWTLLALFVIAAGRLNYSRFQLVIILSGLLLGGIYAVAESFRVWHFNGREFPEFRSVGHVNHSSMYSLVTLGVGLGALYFRERWLQLLGVLGVFSTLVFFPASRSIVGGVAILVILTAAGSIEMRNNWSWRGIFLTGAASIVFMSAIIMMPPFEGFRMEILSRFTGDNFFSGRDKILNSALVVWSQNPIFGTGWFSFGPVTSEAAVRAALENAGAQYNPHLYLHHNHGHNLWVTVLIERGLVGLTLISTLLFLYFRTFLPNAFGRDQGDKEDRGVAIGALLVATGFFTAGLGNTTMMNEHGHAGMLFISVAYGYLRARELLL